MVLPDYLRARGVPFHVIEQDTYSVVKRLIPEGSHDVFRCARACGAARCTATPVEHGITKIALGHHRDDIVETLFLNLFSRRAPEGDGAEIPLSTTAVTW